MALSDLLTRGFSNGTFTSDIAHMVTRGFDIGAVGEATRAGRVLTVPARVRTITVEARTRTLTVPARIRSMDVSETD